MADTTGDSRPGNALSPGSASTDDRGGDSTSTGPMGGGGGNNQGSGTTRGGGLGVGAAPGAAGQSGTNTAPTFDQVAAGRQSLGEGDWIPGENLQAFDANTSPLLQKNKPQMHTPQVAQGSTPDPGAATQPVDPLTAPTPTLNLAPGPGVGGFYGRGFSPFGKGSW